MAGPNVHQLVEMTDTPDADDELYVVHSGSVDRKIRYDTLNGPVTTVTANYTVTRNNGIVFASGDVTIYLALASRKWKVTVVNIGTGVVKIAVYVESSDTIEGYSEINLAGVYEKAVLQADGGTLYVRW